jgi:pyruvate-formate lyase-activating enzyme
MTSKTADEILGVVDAVKLDWGKYDNEIDPYVVSVGVFRRCIQ